MKAPDVVEFGPVTDTWHGTLFVVGGGGHGRDVADIAETLGWAPVFLDDQNWPAAEDQQNGPAASDKDDIWYEPEWDLWYDPDWDVRAGKETGKPPAKAPETRSDLGVPLDGVTFEPESPALERGCLRWIGMNRSWRWLSRAGG